MIGFSRRLGTHGALVVVWCALWGSFSVANVASGIAVVALLWVTGAVRPNPGTIRLVPLIRLIGLVTLDLVQSTVSVARAALGGSEAVDEGVLIVDLPDEARDHLLLIVTAVTLTPGTAVLDKQDDPCRLWLHLLNRGDAADVQEHVMQLVELTNAAFPRTDVAATGAAR